MEQHNFIHAAIHWIRTSVLILSILVIITSLNQYSKKSTSVFTLLHDNNTTISTYNNENDGEGVVDRFGQALVQDRRLIATLVAAQASVFCPLFLLLGNNRSNFSSSENEHPCNTAVISLVGFWEAALDLLCQFLLPLGLALSWLFCISFDHRTSQVIHDYSPSNTDMPPSPSSYISSFAWDNCTSTVNTVHGLKYLIVMALVFEMIFITIAWIQYCISSFHCRDSQKKHHLYLLPTEADHKQRL
ncbi:hypothetical protein BCR42DRAFT_475671, partial [Absidia repens]